MKLNVIVKVNVLDKVINDGSENKKYYNLTVFDSASHEAGTLRASQEVFDTVSLGKVNTLMCEYNDRYNSFRAVSVVEGK